jgi:toxin ParE1/3/4
VKGQVTRRAEAKRDLDEQAAFMGKHSLDLELRFLAAAESEFERLAAIPGLGSARRFANPQLAGVRMWRIHGLKKHLIFYPEIEGGIEVIRILHASRDIERILEAEELA